MLDIITVLYYAQHKVLLLSPAVSFGCVIIMSPAETNGIPLLLFSGEE